jgi:hypothetical protein
VVVRGQHRPDDRLELEALLEVFLFRSHKSTDTVYSR